MNLSKSFLWLKSLTLGQVYHSYIFAKGIKMYYIIKDRFVTECLNIAYNFARQNLCLSDSEWQNGNSNISKQIL